MENLKTEDEEECLHMLRQFLRIIPSLDSRWFGTDRDGNTVLHTAALDSRPKCVSLLLNEPFGPQMCGIRNGEGDTLFQALLHLLESRRTKSDDRIMAFPRHKEFCGHPIGFVRCLAALKGMFPSNNP